MGIHNTNNLIQDGLLKSDKNKDIDGDKNNNRLYPKNETLNIQKIKTKIQKCPSNNINIKKSTANLISFGKSFINLDDNHFYQERKRIMEDYPKIEKEANISFEEVDTKNKGKEIVKEKKQEKPNEVKKIR